MAELVTKDIRNIALLGHGSEGKTTLTEAMLFAAGLIDRQGKVEDGSTVSDYDPEEIKRGISISASVAPLTWKNNKINVIDVPGYFDFIGEAIASLRVVETAGIVVGAVSGVTVGAEKAWDNAGKLGHVCRMFIVNQMDRENADYHKVLEALRDKFGSTVVPLVLPIGSGASFKGVVNILENKAYEGAGKAWKEAPIPADMSSAIEEGMAELTEAAASEDDELMMKYLEGEELTHDEIVSGFQAGIKSGNIVPVVPVSALTGVGIRTLLNTIVAMHSPAHTENVGVNPKTGDEIKRPTSVNEPFSAFVFKTIADPFVGKLSLVRVCSGTLTSATALYNSNSEKVEKAAGIYFLRGKKQQGADKVIAGDIAAISKLSVTASGDTLCDQASPIRYPSIEYPVPCLTKAVSAAKQGEEDKVFSGLARLMEEDPSIKIEKNAETTETVLSGQGDLHLDVIKNKLASKFGANAVLSDPRIPYRETIRKTVSVQGRHKKQTGGHGQFGDVWIEFSPIGDANIQFEFEDAVVGGAVPRNFIPSVEKGLRENIVKGVLAGYPMVGLHAKLYDGSYHPVDSSEMAFKTAARIAYKKGCMDASPVLLEPILHVEVFVPDEYMGDIMGDMNKRRGRIMGMDQVNGMQRVTAEVPMGEMFKYATDLRSMTQARGYFTQRFERYEEMPSDAAKKIIESAVKDEDEDE